MNDTPTASQRRRSSAASLAAWLFAPTAALLLVACPGDRTLQKSAVQPASGEYPKAALEYLEQALAKPTEGYPALAYTWSVIAQLDKLQTAPGGEAIRARIGELVQKAGDRPPAELVAAWFNCSQELATGFFRSEAGKGNWRYVVSLKHQPELARRLLASPATRIMPRTGVSADLARQWLELQQFWADVKPEDKDLLVIISERANDPANTLRAAGWILRLEPENQRFIDYLELGIKSAEPGDYAELMGATEGIKISRSPALAEILVPISASVPLSEPEDESTVAESNPQQLLAAYALMFLPGEQASLMRGKLLNAADPKIYWQARLGEKLHGNPGPWDEGLRTAEPDMPELWLALDRVDSPEPALLPTYRWMVEQGGPAIRLRVAGKLGRFRPFAGNPDVVELVTKLMKDETPEVRAAAWYSAGRIGIGEPLEVLGDKDETPEVRLAAAYAALMHAQGGPPELRQANFWSITGAESGAADEPEPTTDLPPGSAEGGE